MKSEREETVTEFEGVVTEAYPTGLSLIESVLDDDDEEELEEDDDYEHDDD